MGIDVEVYDSAGTLIGAPNKSFGRGWRDEWNEVGSGQWSMGPADAGLVAQPTMKRYGNIARFKLDGTTVFSMLTEGRKLPPAPSGEHGERVWTFTGRGTLALLEDSIVYPEGALAGNKATNRYFGWMSGNFDDSSWGTATQIAVYNAGYSPGLVKPLPWPGDPNAYWIWSQPDAGSAPYQPVGASYFRRSFTLATAEWVGFFATADDALQVWVDGQLIIDNTGNTTTGFHDCQRADLRLEAGTHQVAIKGVNLNIPQQRAAVLLTAVKLNSGSHRVSTPLTIYTHTSNTWKTVGYPTVEPGMTVGEILTTLFSEGQARGCYAGITPTFSASVDSLGASWPASSPRNWPVGTTILDVIRSLTSQDLDVRMDFLDFYAYLKGTYGRDLTGSVSLAVGRDFASLDADGQAHLTNAVLLRDQTGQLTEGTSASSLAVNRRKETYDEVGTAADATQALVVANGVFTGYSEASAQMNGLIPQFVKNPTTGATDVPTGFYTDWRTGDTITMPANDDGATAPMKVLALTISEDVNKNVFAQAEGMEDDG